MNTLWTIVFVSILFGTVNSHVEPPITAMAWCPDTKFVIVGSQLGVRICNWPELKTVDTLNTELEHVHDLRFSPDGQTLLVAGGSPGEKGEIELWNWQTRSKTRLIAAHNDVVYRVDWSPNGSKWVTGSADGTCQVFMADRIEKTDSYEGHSRSVLSVTFLNHDVILSAGIDQTIRMWRRQNGVHQRTLDNHVGSVNAIAVSPSGAESGNPMVASISEDRTIRIWQPSLGRLVRFLRLPSVPRCFLWSADGKEIYVGCNDGLIRVIDVESMAMNREFDGGIGRIHELLLGPDTVSILVGGERGVRVLAVPH
jgi:WD40 repeat protein